ncbi:hypothetical protein MBLNU230_g3669t1 [Neophaeotheca triangularis]
MLYGAHKFQQLEEALESHRRHCTRWGCQFENLDRDLAATRKLFSKQYFLLSTLLQQLAKPEEERQEWLLWVDADSIVINPAISPCVFLPPREMDHIYALVTADHNGLNDGVFYLKVCAESLDFLTQVLTYTDLHPEADLGWFGEQAAMSRTIKTIEAKHKDPTDPSGIAWIPRTWINHYEFEHGFEGEPGSFMVHFAGLGATRLTHMQNWLNELRYNQAKWEIPVEETVYKDEIAAFWKEYAANMTGRAG